MRQYPCHHITQTPIISKCAPMLINSAILNKHYFLFVPPFVIQKWPANYLVWSLNVQFCIYLLVSIFAFVPQCFSFCFTIWIYSSVHWYKYLIFFGLHLFYYWQHWVESSSGLTMLSAMIADCSVGLDLSKHWRLLSNRTALCTCVARSKVSCASDQKAWSYFKWKQLKITLVL